MAQDVGSKQSSTRIQENNFSSFSESSLDNFNNTNQAAFSIATPAVTTILPMTENINDTSFISEESPSYQRDIAIEQSYSSNNITLKTDVKEFELYQICQSEGNSSISDLKQHNVVQSLESNETSNSMEQPQCIRQPSLPQYDQGNKLIKKRNRVMKKNTKLDAKSKLEKSRQSARECRARKKLRYQYLEDLVSNREKAVIKLKEELSMICEISTQLETGNITEAQRRLLSDQTKENNYGDSTLL